MTGEAPQGSAAHDVPSPVSSDRARRVRAALAAILVGGLALASIWVLWPSRGRRPRDAAAAAPPRVGASAGSLGERPTWPETPYLNARPGVDYVGDAACAPCHAQIARTYARHPMGRSLRPMTEAIGCGEPPFQDRTTFEVDGLAYSIERRGDRVYHVEVRRDAQGRELARNEAEARFVVGSGRRAFSFLIERGSGYLFESPVSWYAQEQTWDRSPGFERDNPHFERPIRPACLFCHANRTEVVAGTENHYRPPIFQGHAIGCERCHGPGAVHVRQPIAAGDQAPTIVNPAGLEPATRESVCQQCHLQGDVRLVRAGRSLADYRPGLSLHEFIDVYFQTAKLTARRFVGQVEQMQSSRCFLASRGSLGCISCHDPHEIPEPAEKLAYYRDRCLNCHQADEGALGGAGASARAVPREGALEEPALDGDVRAGPCLIPRGQRLRTSPADSCIDCHMPRAAPSRIPHTATSDHRIPRFGDRAASPGIPARRSPGSSGSTSAGAIETLLISFFAGERKRDRASGRASPMGQGRDLGVALSIAAPSLGETVDGARGTIAAEADRRAIALLERALARAGDDPEGWQALGRSLWRRGRRAQSLAAFRRGLSTAPGHEALLIDVATRAAQLQQNDLARWAARRLIALNPWRADYHHVAALVATARQVWDEVIDACRASIRLDAHDGEIRLLLVQALHRSGDPRAARAEFEIALQCDPSHAAALRRWFAVLQSGKP